METYLSHLSVHEFKRGRDGIFAFVHTLDYRKPGQKLTEQKFTWNSKGWLWNGRLRGKKNTLNWCFVVLCVFSFFFCISPCQHAICLFVKYSHVDGSLSLVGLCSLLWVSAGKLRLHAQRVWMNWDRLVQETATAKTGGKKWRLYKRHLRGKTSDTTGGYNCRIKATNEMYANTLRGENKDYDN